MDAQEEVVGYSKEQTHMIMIKRKRTKRPRPPSPLALTMASTSTTTTTTEHDNTSDISDDSGGFLHLAAPSSSSSPINSIEFTKIIQEEDEQDMANCLILLAQGHAQSQAQQSLARNKGGFYVYECKTCNRTFPSFQALGGHRASHKRPKIDEKKPLTLNFPKIESHDHMISKNHPITLSLQINPSKPLCTTKNSKIHECSICGAEFSSGQALGGHMRRHRPMPVATSHTSATSNESHQEVKKSRTLLSLDLNLPAPEDHDHHESKFSYGLKEKIIVFSSPSMVDCHF